MISLSRNGMNNNRRPSFFASETTTRTRKRSAGCLVLMITCIYMLSTQPHITESSRSQLQPTLGSVAAARECNATSECPTWFACNNHTCECQSRPEHIIKCDQDEERAGVLACYCVTTDKDEESSTAFHLVVGSCLFNCARRPNSKFIDAQHRYFVFSDRVSDVNNDTCGRFKRTGPLCGKCLPNHSPKVYSFNMNCVECLHAYTGWLLFIFFAFVPLTLFYLVILLLNVNVASSSLHAFVLFCQIVTLPPLARAFENSPNPSPASLITEVFMTFYGIWNLDFFRFFLPSMCLNTSALVTISLEYIVAIYPLFLVFITYILINLYDRNTKVLVILCRPFKGCVSWFHERHKSKTTIIDAFVTFFVLSFVKVISVSFDLLYPVPLYSFNSSDISYVLFYDGSVRYFGTEHLPFAIVAIVCLLVIVIIPVIILLFYPYRWFQRLLHCLPSRWYLVIQAFVDAMQGCYKNGTEQGSHDYRSFAGLYFIFRITAVLIYALTLSATFYIICGIFFLFFVMLLLVLQPYKSEYSHYTNLNAGFIVLVAILWFSLTGLSYIPGPQMQKLFLSFALICWITPMIYALKWLFLLRKKTKKYILILSSHFRTCCRSKTSDNYDDEEPIPHRITESYHSF